MLIAYVSCAAPGYVAMLGLDPESCNLTLLGRTHVPGPLEPRPGSMALALSPDHRLLYAAARNAPHPVSAFSIDQRSGALDLLGTAELPGTMAYIATDRAGSVLFGASYHQSLVSVSPIGSRGVPGPVSQILPTPPKAHAVLPEPEGEAVLVASLGGDVLLRQMFDAKVGRLSEPAAPWVRTRAGAGPRHFRFARGGARLYLLNELDATLNVYHRDSSSGALAERQSLRLADLEGTLAAADIQLTPNERFLYASERKSNIIAAFRLDEEGLLQPLGNVPGEPEPRSFAIDPTGRALLCAGQSSGRLAAYAIDPSTGTLTRKMDIEVGGAPTWVEIIEL